MPFITEPYALKEGHLNLTEHAQSNLASICQHTPSGSPATPPILSNYKPVDFSFQALWHWLARLQLQLLDRLLQHRPDETRDLRPHLLAQVWKHHLDFGELRRIIFNSIPVSRSKHIGTSRIYTSTSSVLRLLCISRTRSSSTVG